MLFIIGLLLIFFYLYVCKDKYRIKDDVEEIELDSLTNNETCEKGKAGHFTIENEIDLGSNIFSTYCEKEQRVQLKQTPEMYGLDTMKTLDKLNECNHHSLYLEFDRNENINRVFIHNKSIKTLQRIEQDQTEKWEEELVICSQNNPMQQNKGKGRMKSGNQGIITMKSNEEILQKCSLISIVLALFNTNVFKLCISKMSENFTICSIGKCDFCLIFNLFMRQQNSKKNDKPC